MDTFDRAIRPRAGTCIGFICLSLGLTVPLDSAAAQEALSPHVAVSRGAVNGVCIERDGHRLVVYGDPNGCRQSADMVLFTHARREVSWAGRSLVENDAESVVPAAEAESFLKAEEFWTQLWEKRHHDYAQQSTRVPTAPLEVGRTVRGGDVLSWRNLTVRVLDTPGYTRGAVSYTVEVDGLTYGFVGDLLYGNGRLLDLYSLQDRVSDAGIGGYHGYAGRIGDLIGSLQKIAAVKPDILVPAHGPVIREPAAAIDRLIQCVRAAYENYLSISAGRWYFKERYDVLAARALGRGRQVKWMPYAATIEKAPPDWIIPIHNSRLILSRDRSAFLIDCGSRAIIDEIGKLKDTGAIRDIEGLFITHYHDDHTDRANELVRAYGCPVYVTPLMEDVIRRPGAYRLPAMTANPIDRLRVVPDGHRMRWKEFGLTFYDFPGQTLYHDALLVERDTGETVFFIGDSFTPSGLDDYCLQNRNFIRDGRGYLYCLDLLETSIPPQALLINQHVVEPFRFDREQVAFMKRTLDDRRDLLRALFPWDGPDYGLDEQWARIYPYGQESSAGARVELAVKLLNHSDVPRTFRVALNVPEGFAAEPEEVSVAATPGEEVEARFAVKTSPDAPCRVHVLTADVRVGRWDLRQWCEGLVRIVP